MQISALQQSDSAVYIHFFFFPLWLNETGGLVVKNSSLQCRLVFNLWVRTMPWRRKWQSTPVFLPGEFYGQRILKGYSPWGRKESEMTEQPKHSTAEPFGNKV